MLIPRTCDIDIHFVWYVFDNINVIITSKNSIKNVFKLYKTYDIDNCNTMLIIKTGTSFNKYVPRNCKKIALVVS